MIDRQNPLFHSPILGYAHHRIVLDDRGRPIDYAFLEVNATFEKLTGLKAETLIGRTARQVIPEIGNDEFDWIGSFGDIALNNGEKTFEQYSEPLGRWYHVHVFSTETMFFTTLFLDITESREAQERVCFDNQFRQHISKASARFVQVNDSGSLDAAIDATLADLGELFGVDRSYLFRFSDDLSTMDNTHEWCAPDISSQKDRIQQFVTDRLPWWKTRIQEHKPVHCPDVASLPLEAGAEKAEFQAQGIQSLVCLPICGDGANLIGFIGFDAVRSRHCWPMTQIALLQLLVEIIGSTVVRLGATHALIENEKKYRFLVEYSSDLIWILTANGVFTFVSPSWKTLLGYEPTAMEGKAFQSLVHSDDVAICETYLNRVLEAGKSLSGPQYRVIHADGTWRWHEGTINPVFAEDGTLLHLVGVSKDITERKQAEAEREMLQEQFTQAQKMETVGRLAGGVAHDFNNMLAVILGNTEMAMAKLSPENPLRADLEDIREAASRSANLTRQLLAFARKQTISPRVMQLNDTVQNMLKMLRRLIGEDIELVFRPCAGLWPVKVDPGQVDQILANLCVNARDAIADVGRITIETEHTIFDDTYCADHLGAVPGEYVQISVSDNGCGMDEEIQACLFEPFYTTKELGQGTGLGLATVYGVVKQNGGYITVESEMEQGTTFRLYLPRYLDTGKGTSTSVGCGTVTGGRETVLVVEDEAAILKMTSRVLQRLGYTVLTARSPQEALRLVEEHCDHIELLLTDVIMPGMNGRDLAQTLTTRCPKLKCLFMSGYTADVIALHGVLEKDVHFIQKPFSVKDLSEALRRALDAEERG